MPGQSILCPALETAALLGSALLTQIELDLLGQEGLPEDALPSTSSSAPTKGQDGLAPGQDFCPQVWASALRHQHVSSKTKRHVQWEPRCQPGATWGVRGAQVCKAAQGQPTPPWLMTDIPNRAPHNHCCSLLTLPLQRTVCHR